MNNETIFRNVVISKAEKYIPRNKVKNDFFIDHFNKEGKQCEGLLKAFQRDERYFADSDESSLSLGIKAVEKVLEDIDKDSIDMLIFVSATPEYTAPTNAIKIVDELNLVNCKVEFDMNVNCTGVLDAFYIASNIMKNDKKISRCLIVGTEMFSTIVNYHDTVAYSQFADGSCAVLLETKEEPISRGFLDFEMCNYTKDIDNIVYPKIGFSNVLMTKPKNREKRLEWIPFKTDYVPEIWKEMITNILKRNEVSNEQIVGWCMSQLFPRENVQILTEMNHDLSNYVYVGDKYGYTGCSSPIFALAESDFLEKEGYIIFNSVATGCHFCTVLYKN